MQAAVQRMLESHRQADVDDAQPCLCAGQTRRIEQLRREARRIGEWRRKDAVVKLEVTCLGGLTLG